MKKLLIFTIIILLIPYIIYNIYHTTKEEHFNYNENIFVRVKRNKYNRIDVIPLEDYVVGVVAGEMPVSFHEEALKAQAIASRTYVLDKINQNINNEYDVIDTVSNQVYLDNETLKNNWKENYIENMNKIRNAVNDTKGEFITYDGKVITAFFFSTSVGKTENSEDIFVSALPYLKSVDSSWDEQTSPVFKELNKFTLNDFYTRLNLSYSDKINYEVLDRTSTGRIKQIKINNKIFKGSEVASVLNLRSSFFTIEQDNNDVYITTKGYGHGVGMSQYGALGMAKEGYKCDEIIKHYYKGVKIEKI